MPKSAAGFPDEDPPSAGPLESVRIGPGVAERVRACIRAAELRARHVPYDEIARVLGLASGELAQLAVRQGLALVPAEDVREVRRLEDERLHALARKALEVVESPGPLVSQGKIIYQSEDGEGAADPYPDQMVVTRALEVLLNISKETRKLHGADAPKRSVTFTADMITARIAELKAELGLQGGLPPGLLPGQVELPGPDGDGPR